MVIIIQCYRTQVDIVTLIRWAMDYHRTPQTVGVLAGIMRMIECASIRSGLEGLGEAAARSNWTHGYAGNAVFPSRVLLHEAMIVDGSTFRWIRDGIVYSDLDSVSPIGFNWWLEDF